MLKCSDESYSELSKDKCYLDRSLSGLNFVLFWVLFYQIYFVYHLNYKVPIV